MVKTTRGWRMVGRFVVRTVLLSAVVVAGCGPRTVSGPRQAQQVSLETVITDEIPAGQADRRYLFEVDEFASYAVFVQGLEGRGLLRVTDANFGLKGAMQTFTPGMDSLETQSTLPVALSTGSYGVLVQGLPLGTPARYRFKVHRINHAPESSNGLFEIGDAIGTESIDDILDIDDFTTTGPAGHDVVAALEATGQPGANRITLTVYDPTESFQTSATTSVGQPAALTDRLTLPTTGTYRFRVQNVWGTIGATPRRYTGPYRFWTYLIDRAPEHTPAVVTTDVLVSGEDLAPAGDVDEFRFDASANTEYSVFLQSRRAALVRLQALDATGNILGSVDAVPADTALLAHATGRFSLGSSGPVTLRVLGPFDRFVTDTGAYRLFVQQSQPTPVAKH